MAIPFLQTKFLASWHEGAAQAQCHGQIAKLHAVATNDFAGQCRAVHRYLAVSKLPRLAETSDGQASLAVIRFAALRRPNPATPFPRIHPADRRSHFQIVPADIAATARAPNANETTT